MDSADTGCSASSFGSSKSHSSLNYSTDINAISVDSTDHCEEIVSCSGLKYLPRWPAVNLEFSDLTCVVADVERGNKQILRSINGEFRSHELTAIMGPSGAGKTTLLNLLAGYGANNSSGQILVNHQPRDMKVFRKMSRYIMQQDMLGPHFTVREAMLLATHLKLGNDLTNEQKYEVIDEILCMLRLKKAELTQTQRLSGGERKRLCIAMELVNNPPVVFLDEPTTGLDDLSSSQCIGLLRRIAHTGRTIICSIHTPSAKIFNMFDKVYVLADGQCIYQGSGADIVPYVQHIGLSCPRTYNPADFIIEVACREYGDGFHDFMVEAVENGKVARWTPEHLKSVTPNGSDTTSGASSYDEIEQFQEEIDPKLLKPKSSWWMQYKLLLARMLKQMWRDKFYIKLRFFMNIVLALLVGGIYKEAGCDATKAIFNIGFAFTVLIAYLYLPMMPVLLQFPSEIRLLKREYFNQWYRLSPYYVALICSRLPFMLFLAIIYLGTIYVMSSQPAELYRFGMLFLIAILTAMISDSFGMLVSSRLSLVNAMFMGPVLVVPFMIFAVYALGYGKNVYIPPIWRFLMSMSYLRHGMEGLMIALYGYNREDSVCPETEVFCVLQDARFLLQAFGFDNLNYTHSVCALITFYVVFTIAAFVLIKQRLSLSKSNNLGFQYVRKFLEKYLNFAPYRY